MEKGESKLNIHLTYSVLGVQEHQQVVAAVWGGDFEPGNCRAELGGLWSLRLSFHQEGQLVYIGDLQQMLLGNPGIDLPSPPPLPALRSIWWWQEPPLVLYRTVSWCFNSISFPPCTQETEKGDSSKSPPLSECSSRCANAALSNCGVLGSWCCWGAQPSWPLLPAELSATGCSCFLLSAAVCPWCGQ